MVTGVWYIISNYIHEMCTDSYIPAHINYYVYYGLYLPIVYITKVQY